MSADNWRVCPKCVAKHLADIESEEKKVGASYGKVSADEYERLRGTLGIMRSMKMPMNLAEYYEIGTDEKGEFSVAYSASCRVCTFHFEHKHTQSTT